jgi:putative ABC transport system permease protein
VGVVGLKLILLLPGAQSFIEPAYSLDIFVTAFVVAMIVGILGGVYPAVRAASFSPKEAIKYER